MSDHRFARRKDRCLRGYGSWVNVIQKIGIYEHMGQVEAIEILGLNTNAKTLSKAGSLVEEGEIVWL